MITGIPIQDTVDQLISISARPRDTLVARTSSVQAEQSAVDTLASLVLSLQFSANRFNASGTFTGRTASSSSDQVSVSIPSGSTPTPGSYQFTPLQAASANQFVSGSFEDIADAVGSGTLNFGFGGQVDRGRNLAELNSGAGVTAGEIKITDRSGASSVVDLRAARTVDDVLLAINSNTTLGVTATANGDSFVLTDNTGGSGTLSVSDVGLSATATDLGLAGLAASGSVLTGSDVFSLHSGSKLSGLNDGAGVSLITGQDDLLITARDGSEEFGVDLGDATTLGDVVDAINNDEDNDNLVAASISTDGRRLVIEDKTGASDNNLKVTNGLLGTAADDLGLTADVANGTITGARIAAGLKDTLVSSLNGGAGLTLGSVAITDREGSSVTVDLAGLETVSDIVNKINADAEAGSVSVRASLNDSRNGITLTDSSAAPTQNLKVEEVGDGTTASDLGILADTSAASINGGSLDRQTVSESTRLDALNGGAGVTLGDFSVTDSVGVRRTIDLDKTGSEAETVGDVIDLINAAGNGVTASINSTGDGILLTDTAGGTGTLTVAEVGGGSTAADLQLVGASSATNNSGQQVIDGATRFAVDLSDLTASPESISLSTLNGGAGVDAGIFAVFSASNDTETPDFVVDLGEAGAEAFTVGDVINKINEAATAAGSSVSAAVNSAGTGIELTDATGGSETLTVSDLGTGTAAADLGFTATATTEDNGDQTINASGLFAATDGDSAALETLATRINDLGAGVTASVFSDASGYRLAITADTPGAENQLLVDGGATGLSFVETSRATDAVALFGSSVNGGAIAVTSQSNTFNGIVDGLNLTVGQADGETAVIDVAKDDSPFTRAAQDFVDAYNSIRTNLDSVASFDETTNTTGLLFGRLESLRVDSDLSRLVSGRLRPGEKYGSLESVGISLGDDGQLTLDSAKLSEALADDPTGVEELFTDSENGLVTQLQSAVDVLATDENSLLSSRSDALSRTVELNQARIADMTVSLERERESLLLEFFRLEETVALLQSNLDSIGEIQPITIANSSSSS